jgi:hypothetical protein
VLIVAGSIASLKVTVSLLPIGTPVAAFAGIVELTVGATKSAGSQCPVSAPPPHPVIKKPLRIKINKR